MNIIFVTGIVEVTVSESGYSTKINNIDSSVVDNNFITPYLPLVQSTIYTSLKDRFNFDSKYNVMFCGALDSEKNEFSILESDVWNLKVEIETETDLSLNPFY